MAIQLKKFHQIDLNDPFFDSLRNDYDGFNAWFTKKSAETAYLSRNDAEAIDGFLYLKIEDDEITDTTPTFNKKIRLKIGTFKIDAHGTKLGERFIRIALNYAVKNKAKIIYTTVFDKHAGLINLLKKYGFEQRALKNQITTNGQEGVYFKRLVWRNEKDNLNGDHRINYPMISINNNCYLLSIYPQWHTRLFPESKLHNESQNIIQDIPETNNIEKVYLTKMNGVNRLKKGDNLLIYRTAEKGKSAEYSSVATSVCVVSELRNIAEFATYQEFSDYCSSCSVFTEDELMRFYKSKEFPFIIRFTYNISLEKKIIRQELKSITGYNNGNYWGFIKLDDSNFMKILERGRIDESFIFNKA